MNIDFENLPDDPQLALVELIRQFDDLYEKKYNSLDEQENVLPLMNEYINNVLSAAKALDVSYFYGWSLPASTEIYSSYSDLKLQVNSFIIHVKIKRTQKFKIYSVSLDSTTKTKIHHYIKRIREIVDSADLSDRKRNSLFAKLNAFASDVDRTRTGFENAMLAFSDLIDVAKKGTETLKPITDLVNSITGLIGEAKSLEPEPEKLPAPEERKRIEGPKKADDKKPELANDDIPF